MRPKGVELAWKFPNDEADSSRCSRWRSRCLAPARAKTPEPTRTATRAVERQRPAEPRRRMLASGAPPPAGRRPAPEVRADPVGRQPEEQAPGVTARPVALAETPRVVRAR